MTDMLIRIARRHRCVPHLVRTLRQELVSHRASDLPRDLQGAQIHRLQRNPMVRWTCALYDGSRCTDEYRFLCRLALTPRQVVADLLNLTVETVETFKKEKQIIIA